MDGDIADGGGDLTVVSDFESVNALLVLFELLVDSVTIGSANAFSDNIVITKIAIAIFLDI
jgi:hypothetical protein